MGPRPRETPYRVEAVTLVVRELDVLTCYYRDVIGLGVVSAADDAVRLGAIDAGLLGFDVIGRHPGALFLGAGG
ncbi:hypothetical protein [Methylobacterium sp. R2-1]|uniref:hypothetical protein n=1 Tax=Methylobacterium sp. R2-1 TaxID=2587064 RepID=UPI00184618D2|nr:hypothetical protein [Methylobacterium sp. R2-1]MBB2960916.1 catechol-2,3-dioxygenase [Methylobacterium sp. R2-1]